MADISTYRVVTPKASDIVLGTQTYEATDPNPTVGNPTVNFTVSSLLSSDISSYINGTVNTIPIFTSTNIIGDSQLKQAGPDVNGTYQMKFENADRFIIDKPSSVTSGDPEYLIAQDGNAKVSMGWDDDGQGFGFLYNWAGDGWRFGSAGNNPELTIVTTAGQEGVTVANNLDVAGNVRITGTLELLQKNSNTFVGTGTGNLPNTTGSFNTALGSESLNNNTGGNGNVAVGRQTLYNSTGNNNTGTGSLALFSNTTGLQNTGIGRQALQNVTTGDCNVGIGHIAGALVNGGAENTNPFYSVFIGGGTKSKTNNDTNQIVIGRNAIGEGTNTARIGNSSLEELHVGGAGAGIVLKSPNGTAYKLTIADGGNVVVTAV